MSIDVLKALNTAEGDALIPERLDPILLEEANRLTPLRELLKRVPWSTNAYEWNARTVLPTSAFYVETDTYSASNSTYARRVSAIKMLKSEGAVSQLLQDTSKDYINALQAEIDGALQSLIQQEENALINGDDSSPEEFDGLLVQITQSVDALGADVSLDLIDAAIQKVMDAGGKPSLIVMSYRDHMKLNQIMRALMTYNWERFETAAGTKLVTYSGIPIVGSAYMPTTDSYGVTPTADHSQILVLDTSQIVVPVVREVSYQEVPTTVDGTAFRLKMYETLAVKSPSRQCKITHVGKP